jgi:pyruvate-ferredoxin/flavodoxin oxidoreductase
MVDLSGVAVRLYRKYISEDRADSGQQIPMLLSGDQAVAAVEGALCDSVVLGGDEKLEKTWWEQVDQDGSNAFNKPLSSIVTHSARAALASATGLSLAGQRAATFVTGQNVGATQDLLFSASGRHLPLVIHLTNLAMSGHGIAPGTGHEGYHLSSDSGCFMLFAENVQQVADFTFIARRVAETALIPGLVVMDADETARSVQDISLLNPTQILEFIGPADGMIDTPTVAQKLLFGDTRVMVPRWHDVDRPVVAGAVFDAEGYAMGAAATTAYFEQALGATLELAFQEFARLSGRRYGGLGTVNLDGADSVLILQGAACEVAAAVSAALPKTGVLGIRSLRPFPDQLLMQSLKGKQNLIVLERLSPPPGTGPPLLREIVQSLTRTRSMEARRIELPRVHSVFYGIGGAPLRAADLALLPTHLRRQEPSTIHLGIDFDAHSSHPKRQVLLHELKRAYPEAVNSGLRASDGLPRIAGKGTISMAVKSTGSRRLMADVASILHRILAGAVRIRSHDGADFLIHSTTGVRDAGDDVALDIACADFGPIDAGLVSQLREGGIMLVPALPSEQLGKMFAASVRDIVRTRSIQIYTVPITTQSATEETTLGALCGVIVSSALAPLKSRKIQSTREDILRLAGQPDREDRMVQFKHGFNNIAAFELAELPPPDADVNSDGPAPVALRYLSASDDQFDSLPRFWNQTGIMYHNNEVGKLTPDPYLATGTIAPLSAIFRDFSDQRSVIPRIDPEKCTGCGKCWSSCPDSALAPVVISPAALIDHGIRQAGADSLRQFAKQLSARIISQTRKQEIESCAGDTLRQAYAWLSDKLDQTPERQQAVEEALDLVCNEIGSLPVCATEVFFAQAEAASKDSGELLSLVVNPDTCKDCGLCQEVCDDEAITFEPQRSENLEDARKAWNAWTTTPDTRSETIETALESTAQGSIAAINLSRYCLLSMAGGDAAEPGSGEKIALRMILSVTEFRQQPIANGFSDEVAGTNSEIVQEIQKLLAINLPEEDLDLLGKHVDSIKIPLVELSDLAGRVEASVHANPIDTARLSRLLDITRDLSDLHFRLTSGRQGLGRARFGLAIAPGTVARWAAAFPYNSFQAPVVLDFSNETPQIAAGLFEGHLRDASNSIALVRQARLEIDQPAGVEFARSSLAQLTWQDLSVGDRQICPPLLVVGNDETFAGEAIGQVLWSLGSDLPIKIISLVDLDLGIGHSRQDQDARSNMGLLAITGRSAFVAQTSFADSGHLYHSVTQALEYPGPALIRIHTPSPTRHGFEPRLTMERARQSVRSRAFPLFTYNPALTGVHGTRLDLAGNENPTGRWSDEETPCTVAHWAATERRFAEHFRQVRDDEANMVELHEFVELADRARKGKSAFITLDVDEEQIRLLVDAAMITATEASIDSWQVLQELAGLVTPFTAQVEEAVRQQVALEHEEEIAAVRETYERQIEELDASIKSDVAGRVRNQLLRLVNSASSKTEQQ